MFSNRISFAAAKLMEKRKKSQKRIAKIRRLLLYLKKVPNFAARIVSEIINKSISQ